MALVSHRMPEDYVEWSLLNNVPMKMKGKNSVELMEVKYSWKVFIIVSICSHMQE